MRRIIKAIFFFMVVVATTAHAVCTPETINPGAVQLIRPHMSVAAVSGVLGCVPTDLPPPTTFPFGRWIWAVPRAVANSQGLEYQSDELFLDFRGQKS
jgi:hypothetical protein